MNHHSGVTVINGGTFKAVRGVVSCASGTLTINGGTFTKTDLNNKAGYELYVAGGAKVTVTAQEIPKDTYVKRGTTIRLVFADTKAAD